MSPPLALLRFKVEDKEFELKMTSMKNLPGEVLSNIFIRLFARQLARMRSVCKPWNALLTDSSFIKSHLHRSIQNNNNNNNNGILMFFGSMFSFQLCPNPFGVRLSRSPNLELELTNLIKPPVFPDCYYGVGFIIGSVNGLICFYYLPADDFRFFVHIWNPSLSALLTLPSPSLPSSEIHFGFGFDPKTDDYKVLRVTASEVGQQTEVYSMRKGSWKLISQKFPSIIKLFRGRAQVCVDDHLLWLGAIDLKCKLLMIVGFDLGKETYFVMPFPDSLLYHLQDRSNVLGVLSGKLCVMSCVEGGECEVWVMDEYRVLDSWVKHSAFPPFSGDIIPYEVTSNGELFFQVDQEDNYRFGLYDPVAAKTKTFKIVLNFSVSKMVEYVDSLVWIAPPKSESSICDISQSQIGN